MRASYWYVLLLAVGLLCFAVAPVSAASITVDTLTDGLGVAGCSLREAIDNANNDNNTQGGCAAGSGADVITLNVNGTYTLTAGEIIVSSSITIQENTGVAAMISGNNASRVFNVQTTNGSLTLNGLMVQNGSATTAGGCIQVGASSGGALTFNNGTLQNCTTTNSGGAIGSTGGTHSITISNSTLQNNTSGINGGAVSQTGTASVLSISGSIFSNNRAGTGTGDSFGGAVRYSNNSTAVFSIVNTTFNNNRAESTTGNGRGGALHFTAFDAAQTGTISGSTFTNNQALNGSTQVAGGAIYKSGLGSLSISSSIFTGNSAPEGGAIFNNQGSLSVTTSRIQSNTASGNGGAYYTQSGTIDSITASCIVDNGDTAVVDTEVTNDMQAEGNWWGTSWGPRIVGQESETGSSVSNGDSITGDGVANINDSISDVHVGLTSAGSYSTSPTGNWITSVPTVAGAQCMVCSGVSSIGHARACF